MTTEYGKLIAAQRNYFMSGATLSLEARKEALNRLGQAMSAFGQEFTDALKADLSKSEGEIYMLELGTVMDGVRDCLENLEAWMEPQELPSPPPLQPGRSFVRQEPLGVALIVAPWNYPVQLTFLPLAAALAAGNCAILKPSPETPRVVEVMERCVKQYFKPEHVALVQGGVTESTALLRERFDAILYTGSTRVGKIVMEAAARNLTPVCLELGGKSPVLVAEDADLAVAARRIAWGKILNAGQTCIAPDYIMVHESIADELLERLEESFTAMLGPNPVASKNYARIISDAAFDRLMSLAPENTIADRAARKIAPKAFKADRSHPAMEEEIFGPLLPVIPFSDAGETLNYIRSGEKPLAFYVFTQDQSFADLALKLVSSGGACVNDVLLHAASAAMPFGGVGASGMGRYHGKYGFAFFSNVKSVLEQSATIDVPFRYPPYGEETMAMLRSMAG